MGFYETLEQNIAKFGGEDAAYKQKLTSHFRDLLGYSNYRGKRDKALGKSIDLSTMKGDITPAGVKSLVGSAIGMKQDKVDMYEEQAGEVDKAGAMLAAEQIAREKEAAAKARARAAAARNKVGLENGVAFTPTSALDMKIMGHMQQPGITGPEGRTKSLQEFEAELNAYYGDPKNMVTDAKTTEPYRVWTSEEISDRINELIPGDYIGNEDKYYLMSQGYSEKQAVSHQGAWRYASGQMSEPEQQMFKLQNVQMAKALDTQANFAEALKDIHAQEEFKDPETGEMRAAPKYTYSQLVERFPDMTTQELTALKREAVPVYRNSAFDFVNEQLDKKQEVEKSWLALDPKRSKLHNLMPGRVNHPDDKVEVSQQTLLRRVFLGEDPDHEAGMNGVVKTNLYQEMKKVLEADYGDILTPDEITRILMVTMLHRVGSN